MVVYSNKLREPFHLFSSLYLQLDEWIWEGEEPILLSNNLNIHRGEEGRDVDDDVISRIVNRHTSKTK